MSGGKEFGSEDVREEGAGVGGGVNSEARQIAVEIPDEQDQPDVDLEQVVAQERETGGHVAIEVDHSAATLEELLKRPKGDHGAFINKLRSYSKDDGEELVAAAKKILEASKSFAVASYGYASKKISEYKSGVKPVGDLSEPLIDDDYDYDEVELEEIVSSYPEYSEETKVKTEDYVVGVINPDKQQELLELLKEAKEINKEGGGRGKRIAREVLKSFGPSFYFGRAGVFAGFSSAGVIGSMMGGIAATTAGLEAYEYCKYKFTVEENEENFKRMKGLINKGYLTRDTLEFLTQAEIYKKPLYPYSFDAKTRVDMVKNALSVFFTAVGGPSAFLKAGALANIGRFFKDKEIGKRVDEMTLDMGSILGEYCTDLVLSESGVDEDEIENKKVPIERLGLFSQIMQLMRTAEIVQALKKGDEEEKDVKPSGDELDVEEDAKLSDAKLKLRPGFSGHLDQKDNPKNALSSILDDTLAKVGDEGSYFAKVINSSTRSLRTWGNISLVLSQLLKTTISYAEESTLLKVSPLLASIGATLVGALVNYNKDEKQYSKEITAVMEKVHKEGGGAVTLKDLSTLSRLDEYIDLEESGVQAAGDFTLAAAIYSLDNFLSSSPSKLGFLGELGATVASVPSYSEKSHFDEALSRLNTQLATVAATDDSVFDSLAEEKETIEKDFVQQLRNNPQVVEKIKKSMQNSKYRTSSSMVAGIVGEIVSNGILGEDSALPPIIGGASTAGVFALFVVGKVLKNSLYKEDSDSELHFDNEVDRVLSSKDSIKEFLKEIDIAKLHKQEVINPNLSRSEKAADPLTLKGLALLAGFVAVGFTGTSVALEASGVSDNSFDPSYSISMINALPFYHGSLPLMQDRVDPSLRRMEHLANSVVRGLEKSKLSEADITPAPSEASLSDVDVSSDIGEEGEELGAGVGFAAVEEEKRAGRSDSSQIMP
ncbi:hypothetical protein N9W34_00750 [Rickettsiales bacterium]|nr:hypothetical protein [Rickettsiales bacterium]